MKRKWQHQPYRKHGSRGISQVLKTMRAGKPVNAANPQDISRTTAKRARKKRRRRRGIKGD